MELLNKLGVALGLCLALGAAQAATVQCPGALGSGLNRYIEVAGALAGGECYYQEGNFTGDNISAHFPPGMVPELIDKDVAPGEGAWSDTSEGYLFGTSNGARTGGTWQMSTDLWDLYAEVFIAFHFGNGGGTPDSFIVELQPDTLLGTWALVAGTGGRLNGLSNIYLFGRGDGGGDDDGDDDDETVPEPGSLALVGLAMLSVGATRRRRGV